MFDGLAGVSHRAARSNDERIGRYRGFFDALGQYLVIFALKLAAYFVTAQGAVRLTNFPMEW
jgi:hypothetical protein